MTMVSNWGQLKTRGSAVQAYRVDVTTNHDYNRSRVQLMMVLAGVVRRIATVNDSETETPSYTRPGAIGLQELTLTPEQAQVVLGVIENRTATCPRPPRVFPVGNDSLLR